MMFNQFITYLCNTQSCNAHTKGNNRDFTKRTKISETTVSQLLVDDNKVMVEKPSAQLHKWNSTHECEVE